VSIGNNVDRTKSSARMENGGVGKSAAEHFNGFPNDVGFSDITETTTPIELAVSGTIPEYVRGVLYRTGPGSFTTPRKNGEIFKLQHW
jgi:torulene dioxygenase